MAIFYAAVDGDPLTSGKGGYVHATFCPSTIEDESGKPHRIAFIGDGAWCVACKSDGVITYGVSVRKGGRMLMGGREQAVGGDLVLCKCSTPPRIVATYAKARWQIVDTSEASPATSYGMPAATPTLVYDQQFVLRDSRTGEPLSRLRYRITTGAGQVYEGTTDERGKTERVKTSGAEQLRLEILEE
ncbi:hypothetical protein ACN9M1_15580 [Ralstonia sp. R-29]|uniref:PAAR domain-containing protein n=1 Tax=Ralstonia sp. R-29 TaxID=3404059 RepID=UPI003CEB2D03